MVLRGSREKWFQGNPHIHPALPTKKKRIEKKHPPNLLQEIRKVIREELQEESSRSQDVITQHLDQLPVFYPPPKQRPASLPIDPLEPPQIAEHPTFTIPSERKGWWEPRPLPTEIRQRPTHPATQLVMMTGLFMFFAVLIQLILSINH